MHELEHRLSRLERQNRTLRRWLVALTVVSGVAMFAGAAAQKADREFGVVKADFIHTKQLVIAERTGLDAPRIRMTVTDGNPFITFRDIQHDRIIMGIYQGDPIQRMADRRGKTRWTVYVPPGATTAAMDFKNAKGKLIHRIAP